MCWPVVCLPILNLVNCPTYPSLLLFIGSLYNWMSLEPNNKKIEYSSVLYLVLILSYHNWIESWEALSVHSVCIYFPSLNIFQLPFWTFLHVKPNMYRPTFPFSPAALFLQGAEVRHISARADLLFSDPLLSTALSSPVNGNCLRPCEILCPTPSQNPWFCYDNHTSLRQLSGPDSKCVTLWRPVISFF